MNGGHVLGPDRRAVLDEINCPYLRCGPRADLQYTIRGTCQYVKVESRTVAKETVQVQERDRNARLE